MALIPQNTSVPWNGKAVFIGLAGDDVLTPAQADLYRSKGFQLWAMNDFYLRHPWLFAELAFNIHEDFDPSQTPPGRWEGDWVKEYSCRASAAVLADAVPGLEIVAWKYPFDEALARWPEKWFRCTVSYMFALALMGDAKGIVLRCISLNLPGEYDYQAVNVMRWIREARNLGCAVTAAGEDTWASIDWTKIPEDENPRRYAKRKDKTHLQVIP